LIIDHVHQSRTVRELDDIDAGLPKLLGNTLPKHKILFHDEAQRIGGFIVSGGGDGQWWGAGHDAFRCKSFWGAEQVNFGRRRFFT
jgi:hypothetical protein